VLKVALVLVAVAATVAGLVECAQTRNPRLMPRWAWLVVILLVPVVGPVAWFLLGRQRAARRRGPSAPDDDPRFLRELDDEVWRRKQQEKRRKKPGGGSEPHPDANPA